MTIITFITIISGTLYRPKQIMRIVTGLSPNFSPSPQENVQGSAQDPVARINFWTFCGKSLVFLWMTPTSNVFPPKVANCDDPPAHPGRREDTVPLNEPDCWGDFLGIFLSLCHTHLSGPEINSFSWNRFHLVWCYIPECLCSGQTNNPRRSTCWHH